MSKNTVVQTGPKTLDGKRASCKNAQKASIFTKGYLPSENPEQKQAQFEKLCEQWGATDPTRQLLLRTVEEASLGYERLMLAIKQKIEAQMQSLDVAREFVRLSGINPVEGMMIPSWYFKEGDPEKVYSKKIFAIYVEVLELSDSYSDQLTAQVAQRYPNLYSYVTESYPPSTIFSTALGKKFGKATPIENLRAMQKEIEENYRFHLVWWQEEERYEIIIAGIRAGRILEAMDLDKYTRYTTSFQNRILKGIHSLAIIDQYEAKTVQALSSGNIDGINDNDEGAPA